MHTLEQARTAIAGYLADECAQRVDGLELVILDEFTEGYEFGWVFYYNSRQFFESRDPVMSVVGNAPLIYERETGRILVTGTAYPTSHYVKQYRLTGNPHGRFGSRVRLTDWAEGACKIPATKAIRAATDLGLADAKKCVDDCLEGRDVVIDARTPDAACQLVQDLQALNFSAEQIVE